MREDVGLDKKALIDSNVNVFQDAVKQVFEISRGIFREQTP